MKLVFLRMSSTVSTSQCGASLLEAIKSIAPHLTYNTHKGHCGRIGIVGGSSEYCLRIKLLCEC